MKYGAKAIKVLEAIWAAADYPWSVRLKAMIPYWLPWARKRMKVPAAVEAELLAMSARTMDRRLSAVRVAGRRRLYGRTKPGVLLKHQIPVRTDRWNVTEPGWGEIDLVSHSGPSAAGEFAHSMNFTDIHSTWVETRAVLGKGQTGILCALNDIQEELPFELQGLDSDNGGEFINHHVVRFCKKHKIQFTRGRPYKKDDNAHIEQKNWTHVRRLVGWDRIDDPRAVAALDELYRGDWRLMMNLFQPSVKLLRKERIGSRLKRVYDTPKTPLDRLRTCPGIDQATVAKLLRLRAATDPFTLARAIEQKIERIADLASRRERSDRVTSQMA